MFAQFWCCISRVFVAVLRGSARTFRKLPISNLPIKHMLEACCCMIHPSFHLSVHLSFRDWVMLRQRVKKGKVGRHLVGVWIGGVWNRHFQSPKNIIQRPKFAGKSPSSAAERAVFVKFRLRNLKIQIDTFSSATDSHPSQAAHLTEDLARGRSEVDSWPTFGQFWLKMTTSDRKPTKNRLKIDPLQDLNRAFTPKKREGLWLKSKCLNSEPEKMQFHSQVQKTQSRQNTETPSTCEVGVLLTLQKHRKNSSDPKVTQK